MKKLLLILPALLFCSCATTLYDRQTGKPIAKFQSDVTNLAYTDGSTTLTAVKMSNSVPTRAALLGVKKIGDTVESGISAVMLPGSGAAPIIGRAAITTIPHLTNPLDKPGD